MFKGPAYSLSLGDFRGGPVFRALFLGAAAGIIASHLPGFPLPATVPVAIGAAIVAVLRQPLTAIIVATLLTSHAGGNHNRGRTTSYDDTSGGITMGLLRNRGDAPSGRRFQMQEKLASIGDDSWIEDDRGDRVYKVDGKALRVRDTFILKDRDGNEVAKIQEKKLRVRGTMEIERDGHTLATIHKALVGIRDRFDVDIEDGEDLSARGNVVDHEYEIKRNGDVIATVSKKWLRVRDTYGIEVREGEDEPLLLALTVAIDKLSDG